MTARRMPEPGNAMGRGVERSADSGETFRRLLTYAEPYRARLVLIGVAVVGGALSGLAAPWLLGIGIDDYVAVGDRDGLRTIVGVLILLYGLTWLLGLFSGRGMASIAQRMMAKVRQDLFAKLQTLSMRFFDRNRTGDLMSRVTNDVDAVDQLLSQNLLNLVVSVVQIVSLLLVMFVLDWRMTLAALIPVPIVMLIVGRIGKISRPAFGRYQASIGSVNAVAQERLAGQRVVVSLDRQGEAKEEFATVNEESRALGIRAQTLTVLMFPIMFGLGNLSTVSVVGVGAWLAVSGPEAGESGAVTVGLIAAFVGYAGQLGRPLGQIANMVTSLFAALAGAARVFELMDEQADLVDEQGAPALPPVDGLVDFDEVDFSYEAGTPILSDIDFEARPGQMIGLVGPTGAGKSTIINVLNRFYDIDGGSVTVDGHDIRAVTKDSLRDQLGIVLQRTFLFTDTVRENIRFGRLEATDAEVEEAARLANADHFIRALPLGYETMVSEGGNNLSLGQRQLLAIARAMLAEPRLLVLDEATSSVDTRTERDIQQALLQLMADRTSFVIAHRLSTIRDADQILVIDDGRIKERGTHEELVTAGGTYQQLYDGQFRGHDI